MVWVKTCQSVKPPTSPSFHNKMLGVVDVHPKMVCHRCVIGHLIHPALQKPPKKYRKPRVPAATGREAQGVAYGS